MPTYYEVKQGDCISSIAYEYGFFPETIWNHPSNAELKNKRKDPNTLCAGDMVVVPDKREKTVTKPSGEMHKFRLSNTPALCSLQLFDQDDYRANQNYELEIDGVIYKGKTNAEGVLRVGIPPNARAGKLIIGEDKAEFNLQFGYIEPPTEIRGTQARLNNLGYDCRVNGKLDEQTQNALRNFQFACGLKETGEADTATLQKLDELHDNVCDIPNRDEVKTQDQSDNMIETPFEEDEKDETENQDEDDSQNELKDSEDNQLERESEGNELETETETDEVKNYNKVQTDNKTETLDEEDEKSEAESGEDKNDSENEMKDSKCNESENDEVKKDDNLNQPSSKTETPIQEEEKSEVESQSEDESESESENDEVKKDDNPNQSDNKTETSNKEDEKAETEGEDEVNSQNELKDSNDNESENESESNESEEEIKA